MIKKNLLLSSLATCCAAHAWCDQPSPISQKPDSRVNYPSNFQVDAGADLFVFGEYLYWIAHEDALYYAHTGAGSGSSTTPSAGNFDFNGHLKKVDPHWDNGLRVGAGLNFPKAGYDCALLWTWFATDAHNHVDSPTNSLLSLWAHPDFSTFPGISFAKGSWHLNLNVGDLEWGRSSWFGGHFSLRPFFGVRGLWLDQHLNNHYTYATIPLTTGDSHLQSDFRGGGLRGGADSRFAFSHGFSLYGLAAGSLLYGEFRANMQFKEDALLIAKTHDHFSKGVSALQLSLALAWDSHFCKDHCHIEFHAGWEQNIYFGVNQMNHFMNNFHSGSYFKENSNLSVQGLIVGGRFDF